jgi:hypothetical protein
MLKKILHAAAALLLTSGLAFAAFNLGFDGKIVTQQGAGPAITGCGTGTLAAGSADAAGTFTATGATGCTLTFAVPFATAPSCVVSELTANTAARSFTVSTTALVVAGGASGSTWTYICFAKAGG